jgi:signal transduction histidine kinase
MMMKDETEPSSEICKPRGEVAHAHMAPWSQHARLVGELMRAVHARDAFIAIAAHELRNPMTPMLGYVEHILSVARRQKSECPEAIIVGLERLAGQVANISSGRRRFSTSRALPRESFAPNFRWSISPQ